MANTSVDGLISGLDTTSLISQLMQLESAQQTQLKTKVSTAQSAVTAYQSVNTRMSALATAAKALTTSTAWQGLTVSSSSSTVKAAATTAATTGNLTFDVQALAASHTVWSTETTTDSAADGFLSGSPIQIGGKDVTPAGTSLNALVSAVNADSANLGVTAAVVQTGGNEYRLQLTATTSGDASAFDVTGLAGAPLVLTEGADARLLLGTTNPQTVTSSSNTFSGLLPGVTFTVTRVEDEVTLSTTSDTAGAVAKVKSLVDAANAATDEISKQSASNPTAGTKGPLAGDGTVRNIWLALGSAVSTVTGGTLADVGIQLDKTGHYTFDSDTLSGALTSDPAHAQALVTALATQLSTVATDATDTSLLESGSPKGSLASAISGRQDSIKDLNDQIADWDIRLAARQQALQAQFSNLEVALGKLKDQSTWLTGQIASLPSWSS